jgi:hypothetical protein
MVRGQNVLPQFIQQDSLSTIYSARENSRMKTRKPSLNLERRKALANLEHRILAADNGFVLVSSSSDGQVSFKRLDEFWPSKPNRKVTR